MPRILLLIILFWILYQVLRRFVSSAKQAPPQAKPAEKIVQCTQCGLHVPESESHIKNNLIICNNPDCRTLENKQK